MNHTADGAQEGHKSRAVREETVEKRVTHAAPGEDRRSLWVFGELVTHKISSHRTGGAYALFEVATQPGSGTPPHVHHREDESFYVLEGDYEFLIEGRTVRAGAGSLLYFPKGTLHAHRGMGEGAGRMLITQTPGGLYERFFEEVGEPMAGEAEPPVFEDQPGANVIVQIAAEHGIEIQMPLA